jgi:hypothetical protein
MANESAQNLTDLELRSISILAWPDFPSITITICNIKISLFKVSKCKMSRE